MFDGIDHFEHDHKWLTKNKRVAGYFIGRYGGRFKNGYDEQVWIATHPRCAECHNRPGTIKLYTRGDASKYSGQKACSKCYRQRMIRHANA